MPDLIISVTDDELAAMQWTVSSRHEKTIPNVETWAYLILRGEIIAASKGYVAARDSALVTAIQNFDTKKPVSDLVAAVDDAVTKLKV